MNSLKDTGGKVVTWKERTEQTDFPSRLRGSLACICINPVLSSPLFLNSTHDALVLFDTRRNDCVDQGSHSSRATACLIRMSLTKLFSSPHTLNCKLLVGYGRVKDITTRQNQRHNQVSLLAIYDHRLVMAGYTMFPERIPFRTAGSALNLICEVLQAILLV